MSAVVVRSRDELVADLVCLTVDVEWACPEVLGDIVGLLDERGLRGTFFCTHPGVAVGDHERGIHPNFRRNGDTVKRLRQARGSEFDQLDEVEIYRHVVRTTHEFCPQAIGVRGHSLFYDSQLLAIYRESGLEYDSSYLLPFERDIRPVQKEYDIIELPIYFADHFDLKTGTTGFDIGALRLDQRGLKIMNFHPNMIFINARSDDEYLRSKPHYHDHERLLSLRNPRLGIRSLFLDLLDRIVACGMPTATLSEVNQAWRAR